jgi:hypothetical protein
MGRRRPLRGAEAATVEEKKREESAYGGAGTCHHMWEKIPMDDRPCVIMEERRNPPMGEQRAVTILWRKDTHKDNPVTMEERNSLMGEQATATI